LINVGRSSPRSSAACFLIASHRCAIRHERARYTEATVAAIFRHIVDQVIFEIEMASEPGAVEDVTLWRQLVLVAYREGEEENRTEAPDESQTRGDPLREVPPTCEGEENDDTDEVWVPPSVDSDDVDDWEFLIECLANRILWEGDYEMSDVFLDADPSEGAMRMGLMGIAEDYYTAIAPDPTDQQLEAIRRRLRWLCGRPESH
jgi:hypothetical protein